VIELLKILHRLKAPPPPPEELERICVEIAERDEMDRRWLWPIGVFTRFVTYAVLFVILCAYWPEDIWQKPFASLTLSDIFVTACFIGIALGLIRALFKPSDDKDIADIWGKLGLGLGLILIIGGVVVGAILLKRG
jgi:hypothetical protein